MGKLQHFNFHPRCASLNLNHLCFAGDVLLFYKGDFKSAYSMLQGGKFFSDTSGLRASAPKSAIYTSGMEDGEVQILVEMSEFSKGSLPFGYLGVPISSKKLNASDCEQLLDIITAKIRIRQSRHISFAGRLKLINSLLMSVHICWGHIFLLLKSVLKKINSVCRSFLWTGLAYSSKSGYTNWDRVRDSKKSGGLGIRNIMLWNNYAIGKIVWNIAQKQDSLWVRLVNGVYVKEKEWWCLYHTTKLKLELEMYM